MSEPGDEDRKWPDVPPEKQNWAIRLFSSSRYFAIFAVFGAFLAAVTLYVGGALVVVQLVWQALRKNGISVKSVQHLQVNFIEMTDVFLLGTVLLIVAFGLYQLFIQPDLPVPPWLKIRKLDQLTGRLVEVVGVLLGVTFLAFVAGETSDDAATGQGTAATMAAAANDPSVLELGAAVAVVIAALSLLLIVSHRTVGSDSFPEGE